MTTSSTSNEYDQDFPSIGGRADFQSHPIPHKHGLRAYNTVASSAAIKVSQPFNSGLNPDQSSIALKPKRGKKKKKLATQVKAHTARKATPLTLDCFIATTRESKPDVKRSSFQSSARQKRICNTKQLASNPLDSTAPLKRRGKVREVPKAKKPTYFKKIIIREKERRIVHLQASKAFIEKRKCSAVVGDIINDGIVRKFETLNLADENSEETVNVDCDVRSLSIADSSSVPIPDIHTVSKRLLHCAAYRDYCDHCLTDEIDQLASYLLAELVRFQDRMHFKDPMKAKIRMRYCCGLKEVAKYISLKKIKCLIIAPDIQHIVVDGVLDRTVQNMVQMAKEYATPVVFALNRQQLAYLSKKKGRVSCIGIMNADGVLVS